MATLSGHAQNNYLDFDGIDDNVDIPDSANMLANAGNITLSCKVYPKKMSFGFPDFDGILGYRNESNFDFYLIQLSSTDVEARFRNSSGAAYTITYTGLVLNQWTQFFLVFNGTNGTLKLYNGNTEVGSVAAEGTVPASSTGTLKIGLITYQDFNWYHDGYIDEVSLWDKALTPAEIGTIVSNGEILIPANEPNLKGYFKFNQGIAYGANGGQTILYDTVGVNNGYLYNFNLLGNSSNWGGDDPLKVSGFNKDGLGIYPNPATDFVSISGLQENAAVKILDMSGRIVVAESVSKTDSKIDVSYLDSGMYIMVINNSESVKFVKK
jgi:hypothetical protein